MVVVAVYIKSSWLLYIHTHIYLRVCVCVMCLFLLFTYLSTYSCIYIYILAILCIYMCISIYIFIYLFIYNICYDMLLPCAITILLCLRPRPGIRTGRLARLRGREMMNGNLQNDEKLRNHWETHGMILMLSMNLDLGRFPPKFSEPTDWSMLPYPMLSSWAV